MPRRLSSVFVGTPSRRLGWKLALLTAWAVGILGMGVYDVTTGRPWMGGFRAVGWLGMCGFTAWTVLRAHRAAVAAERASRGCCPDCGYDLRASPGRCPECGAEPAAAGKGAP